MSKAAAPVSKLARSINTAAVSSQRNAGAALMPKYAELLRNRRSSEHTDSSRGLKTTHRPTPQPSIANRPKPLMQTFHSSAARSQTPSANLDAAVLPNMYSFASESQADGPNMPLLPDNYGAFHVVEAADEVLSQPTIVASNPDVVVPGAPMTGIEGVSLEGVDLKFAHEPEAAPQDQSTLIVDLWKGMLDDVFGSSRKTSTN